MKVTTLFASLWLLGAAPAGQITGKPVPELADFDTIMQGYMNLWGIDTGVLGVMKDDVIVYQRGFGDWENTPFRTASVEKPLTAAAIRVLESWGWLQLTDKAFALEGNGGILPYLPWPSLGSDWLEYVEVKHLIEHKGGWDRDIFGDPMFMSVAIAQAMSLPPPANRVLTLQYMLGQDLQWFPGTQYRYSNFGYMVLGMIIEQLSGMSHHDFIRTYVITPNEWVPRTEIFNASTLQGTQHFREPTYNGPSGCTNVYNVGGPSVPCAYGDFPVENFVGHGHLVASAAPLLEFADRFDVWGSNSGTPYMNNSSGSHTGGMTGTDTILSQRSDDIHVVVLFNELHPQSSSGASHAADVANLIYFRIDQGISWPSGSADGFWVDFGSGSTAIGSYDNCFTSMDNALSWTENGTKLRFKPGSSGNWSGTITQRVLMDAPEGTAIIGE